MAIGKNPACGIKKFVLAKIRINKTHAPQHNLTGGRHAFLLFDQEDRRKKMNRGFHLQMHRLLYGRYLQSKLQLIDLLKSGVSKSRGIYCCGLSCGNAQSEPSSSLITAAEAFFLFASLNGVSPRSVKASTPWGSIFSNISTISAGALPFAAMCNGV